MTYVELRKDINYAGAITTIENSILKWGEEPTRMTENSTEEEVQEYVKKPDNPFLF